MTTATDSAAVRALGARIRESRLARALTQAQLAQTAHVSRTFVVELEAGHLRAELGKVFSVVAALGLDLAPVPLATGGTEPDQLTAAERAEALAEVTEAWEQGRNMPDPATQQIVHKYINGDLDIDQALNQIDALPAPAYA